ncbi:armadillo-type protein [Chlamydoabsidia padenii]|nr:armadillo-type protein [Chlamydoabsidia padenii]
MLDSTLEPTSGTLGDQSQEWNDVFLDESRNLVISFHEDVIQQDSTLHGESITTDFESIVDNDEDPMDWMNEDLQSSLQDSWDLNDLYEPELSMTKLEKLQMFNNSSRIQHRIMVASELLPTLESLDNVQDAVQYVLPMFLKVSGDTDPNVREALANSIGGIILYYFQHVSFTTDLPSTEHIKQQEQEQPHGSYVTPSSPFSISSSSPVGLVLLSSPNSTPTCRPTIPSRTFSYALIELLLDQNTMVSSLCQHGMVAITKALVSGAMDGLYQDGFGLLDQEILQGVIMELYALAQGWKRRNIQQRTFISATSTISIYDDNPSIDQGELHLSKIACLSLISALASYLGQDYCTRQCLPIIENLAKDGLFYVRKEAILAVGNLVHCVDSSVVTSRLVPLYYLFVDDPTWHVRNTCIMMLPILCENLAYEEKCRLVIHSVETFMKNSSPIVRLTLGEVTGEVIAKFLPPDWETTGHHGNAPEEIINFFLSLGDHTNHQPTQYHSIEDDCTLVCAHNFPAVLLTAGATQWDPLFRDKYMRLAKDHQVKVRSSFGHSLHVIAKIIGPVRTVNDLVHIFALYLMDVDEVKSGVMEHLADFLGVLHNKDRSDYLPVLMEIWEGVATNRAFREILVNQLILITPLCTLDQFIEHVLPLVLCACQDEVAVIRDTAAQVFPAMLDLIKMETSGYDSSLNQLVNGLHLLVESPRYRQRLLFANIGHLLLSSSLSCRGFVTHLLDLLLVLAHDSVVNVRIAVSRCLATLYTKALIMPLFYVCLF